MSKDRVNRLINISDTLAGVRYRLEALHLAASGLQNKEATDALQSVISDTAAVLESAEDSIERMKEHEILLAGGEA